jgi:pyruvate formate lyase activating enzyme
MDDHSIIDVISFEHFSTKDGVESEPFVFLQGCPMRCKWCHNPESQLAESVVLYDAKQCIGCGCCAVVCPVTANFIDEIGHRFDRIICVSCGKCAEVCPTSALKLSSLKMTVDEIISEVKKDTVFYGNKGGLTVSGGEPFFRAPEMIKLLKAAKAEGINTVAETCGCFDGRYLSKIVNVTDLFYWDYKDSDPQRHLLNTGIRNDGILKNLFTATKWERKLFCAVF